MQNYIFTPTRLTKDQRKKSKKVGKGNLTSGVRKMIDAYKLEVKSETPNSEVIKINK